MPILAHVALQIPLYIKTQPKPKQTKSQSQNQNNHNKKTDKKNIDSRGHTQGLQLTQLLVKPPCCDISIVPQTALRGQGHSDIDGAIHQDRCSIAAEQEHTDGCDGGQVIPRAVSCEEEVCPSLAWRTWGFRNPLRKNNRYCHVLVRGSVGISNPHTHNLMRQFKPTFYKETGWDVAIAS